ncbi:hypothetical protein PR048_025528 [Dryococelus australis]|uniref:Uncharacterized protein n=1 Tax=Dryococelus australis TaxID=614101 RepID=A0ABQ9GRK7_9NEOP|nr:hypothetical protein PR048_025528 [Dryococelus australis]
MSLSGPPTIRVQKISSIRCSVLTRDGLVVRLLPFSPSPPQPRLSGFDSQQGHSRILACGNQARRRRWSAGFLGYLPFLTHLHSGAAPYSLQSTLIVLKTSMLRAAQIFLPRPGTPRFSLRRVRTSCFPLRWNGFDSRLRRSRIFPRGSRSRKMSLLCGSSVSPSLLHRHCSIPRFTIISSALKNSIGKIPTFVWWPKVKVKGDIQNYGRPQPAPAILQMAVVVLTGNMAAGPSSRPLTAVIILHMAAGHQHGHPHSDFRSPANSNHQ